MNVWLIGGGAYVAVVGFALALCRVSAGVRRDDEAPGCVPESGWSSTECDELLQSDLDEVALAID